MSITRMVDFVLVERYKVVIPIKRRIIVPNDFIMIVVATSMISRYREGIEEIFSGISPV